MSSSDLPTLYWHIVSPYSRAVKVMIDIGKIPCNYKVIDMFKLEQKKPEYRKINPLGLIPVLALPSGQVITESGAIMAYLCESNSSIPKHYLGETPEQKAEVLRWILWANSSFSVETGEFWILKKQYGLRLRKPVPADKLAQAEAKMKEGLQTLDDLIGEKNYLANDAPSIADIFVYFLLTSLTYVGKDHYSYKNIDRWFKKIYAIPEVKAITHQWFPLAKQLSQVVAQIPVQPPKMKPSL